MQPCADFHNSDGDELVFVKRQLTAMRLINTETLEFGEFEFSVGNGKDRSPLPSYAILSHRWYDSGEVEYSHIVDNTQESQYESWQKIKSFCRVAKDRYGLAWAWVDSCCILKSSSAELTEAINAMWRLVSLTSGEFIVPMPFGG